GVLGYEGNDGTVACFTEHELQATDLSGTTPAPAAQISFLPGNDYGTKINLETSYPEGTTYRINVFVSGTEPDHPPAALGAPCTLGQDYNMGYDLGLYENDVVWVFVLDNTGSIIAFTKHIMIADEIKPGQEPWGVRGTVLLTPFCCRPLV
ncbi:MAG: hypothetical protein PHE82_06210, partial [Syntrophomonadaceae bacterium]|nr:hypothetical protein [Syntrophomonadaceae bacterium]